MYGHGGEESVAACNHAERVLVRLRQAERAFNLRAAIREEERVDADAAAMKVHRFDGATQTARSRGT